jgi:hypothetical protein
MRLLTLRDGKQDEQRETAEDEHERPNDERENQHLCFSCIRAWQVMYRGSNETPASTTSIAERHCSNRMRCVDERTAGSLSATGVVREGIRTARVKISAVDRNRPRNRQRSRHTPAITPGKIRALLLLVCHADSGKHSRVGDCRR